MYEKLVEELRNSAPSRRLMLTAADAIEELQKQLREEKVDNVNLTGWLAEEHAKHLWIPVTERLPIVGDYILCYCKRGIGIDYGYSNFDEHAKKEGITHWMPLPEPPKEETE